MSHATGLWRKLATEAIVEAHKDASVVALVAKCSPHLIVKANALSATCQPTYDTFRAELQRLVSRCDAAFRTSLNDKSLTLSTPDHALNLYRCACNSRCYILSYIKRCRLLYMRLDEGDPHKTKADYFDAVPMMDVGYAAQVVAAHMQSLSHLPDNGCRMHVPTLLKQYRLFASAEECFRQIEVRVAHHALLRSRSSTESWLSHDRLPGDVLSRIAQSAGVRAVSCWARTCRAFSGCEELREPMPHLSVRHVPGVFPHDVRRTSQGATCNCVSKKTMVKVFVDLVVTGLCASSDGDASSRRAASCMQTQITRPTRTAMSAGRETSAMRAEQRRQLSMRYCPDELVPESHYRHRLTHETFFSEPIYCAAELVFADTRQPVPAQDCGTPVLGTPMAMRKASAPTRTWTAPDGSPHPAVLCFYINSLSRYCDDRQFMVRVTGRSRTLPNPKHDKESAYAQKLVAYSRPFEILSCKRVIANAKRAA